MHAQFQSAGHALDRRSVQGSCVKHKRVASFRQASRLLDDLSNTFTVEAMRTIGEIRRENLELLIVRAGSLDAVAGAAESSPVYLSQIRNRAQDRKTGRPREMGSAMARRLESAFKVDPGWMDARHQGKTSIGTGEEVPEERGVMKKEEGGSWPFGSFISKDEWFALNAEQQHAVAWEASKAFEDVTRRSAAPATRGHRKQA